MEPKDIAKAFARARIGIGVVAALAPGFVARSMFGRSGLSPAAKTFARMLGGRDIALGLGPVIAIDRGAPVRGWLEAAVLSDTVDLVGALVAHDEFSPAAFVGTAASAGAAAALGLWLSRRLDPPPAAEPGQPEAAVTGHPG